MSKLHLTFACGPYDRTLALRDGTIQPEGIDLNYIASQPPDIFWRMLQFKEFEISEMSLSNHASLVSTAEAPFVAIPAFPSRVFRHGYFFVNTGKGIAKKHLKRIFDLYFTTKERGSGIGLSMVYRTVQMHDGDVEVQSTPGKGTTFTILLLFYSAVVGVVVVAGEAVRRRAEAA